MKSALGRLESLHGRGSLDGRGALEAIGAIAYVETSQQFRAAVCANASPEV
jgi:hypothetical protein